MTVHDPIRARAAAEAAREVKSGMVLGLGTGRTAEAFLSCLADMIGDGLDIVGVPTSRRTEKAARELGIPLTNLDAHPRLDLTVDGADEIDDERRLIKGGGGALLREKIVAAASDEMLVVADDAKKVATLGAFPLPIEIVPFGLAATTRHIQAAADSGGLTGALQLRQADNAPYVTDNGNHIIDASFGRIPDPEGLAEALNRIPGVVEHGLFIGMAKRAVIAGPAGVEWLRG